MAQPSGDGHRKPLMTLNGVRKRI